MDSNDDHFLQADIYLILLLLIFISSSHAFLGKVIGLICHWFPRCTPIFYSLQEHPTLLSCLKLFVHHAFYFERLESVLRSRVWDLARAQPSWCWHKGINSFYFLFAPMATDPPRSSSWDRSHHKSYTCHLFYCRSFQASLSCVSSYQPQDHQISLRVLALNALAHMNLHLIGLLIICGLCWTTALSSELGNFVKVKIGNGPFDILNIIVSNLQIY